jgi:hypothetical protein
MAEKQIQTETRTTPAQFTPRFRTDIYPFIYPSKFRGSLKDKVAIITGVYLYSYHTCHSPIPYPATRPL